MVQVIAKIAAASGGSIYPVVAGGSSAPVAAASAANTTLVWTVTLASIVNQNVGIRLDAPTAGGWQIESLDIRKVGAIRLVNDRVDLSVLPTNLNATDKDPALWGSQTGGIQVQDLGAAALLTDADAAQTGQLQGGLVNGLTNGTTYTTSIRVRKDDTGKATRFVAIGVSDLVTATTTVALDTNTGELAIVSGNGAGYVASGAIEDGDSWLVYISRNGGTGSLTTVSPAFGAGALGSGSVTAVGSCVVDRPHVFQGLISARVSYLAFPFQVELPGEDVESPSVARLRIDNVDKKIVEAIRGLSTPPLADLEVVLASQPEVVEIGFYDLTMRAADYDSLYVEGTLTFEQIFTEPCTLEMTPARFPGMF